VKTYFPDTNFFFECRKAIDLPWHDLDGAAPGGGPDILLIVPPTVITEIERHKTKGNSRTAKRARDISASLREAFLTTDQQAVLREAGPKVVLRLPPVLKVDFSQYPELDRERPDHRIAAECATMNLPDAAVLTDDTLLALATRSIALATLLIPVEWKLTPENDERDDTIAKLQTELKSYKQAAPEIALNVLDANGVIVTELNCAIVRYAPSESDMDVAVSMVKALHPMKVDLNGSPPSDVALIQMIGMWKPVKPEAISQYKNKDYPSWIEEVRKKLAELVSIYNGIAREFTFTVSLANSGFVNAENLTLYLDGFDGLRLLDALDEDDLQDRKKLLSLPGPPSPPTNVDPMWSGMAQLRLSELERTLLTPYTVPRPRQPNKLYFSSQWPGQTPVDHMELVCAALPHQQDATKRSFRASVGQHLGGAPRLRVRVAASNLRKPIEIFIKVNTTEAAGDFLANLTATGTI
jgi:hypothetical protein